MGVSGSIGAELRSLLDAWLQHVGSIWVIITITITTRAGSTNFEVSIVGCKGLETLQYGRSNTSRMRHYVSDIKIPHHRPRDEKIDKRMRLIKLEFNRWIRQIFQRLKHSVACTSLHTTGGGVDKHHCFPIIQLFPHGVKGWIAWGRCHWS